MSLRVSMRRDMFTLLTETKELLLHKSYPEVSTHKRKKKKKAWEEIKNTHTLSHLNSNISG